jgi:F0F1-type ATP synthase assembly protein I
VNDALMFAIGLLADDAPRDTGPDFGKASPFGLIIVVLLLIGTFALVWSMNRHLRKLPKSFDGDESEQTTEDPKSEPGG